MRNYAIYMIISTLIKGTSLHLQNDFLTQSMSLVPQIFIGSYFAHLLRYLIIAGLAFLLFYVLFRRQTLGRKIQRLFTSGKDIRRELFYSLISFAVFSAMGVVTFLLYQAGWSRLYINIDTFGWNYLVFSVVLLIFIHDTWFYWTHRLLHWNPLFRRVHRIHHLSHNPTPWASFSFHPWEAVVQAAIFPLAVLFVPFHPLAALAWLIYMTVMNVLGHLGFEILPQGFVQHWLFRWHNTSVHHNMHHSRVNCNYSLYFNIWDRLMGTNHVHYEKEYDRVTAPTHHPTRLQ